MSKSENKRIESRRNLAKLKMATEKRAKISKQPFQRKAQGPIRFASLLVLLFIATLYATLISSLFIYQKRLITFDKIHFEDYTMTDNNELTPIEIDLGAARKGQMNEIFLQLFGSAIQGILGAMFGGGQIPVKVKGNKEEISAFAKTLGREKKYIKSVAKYGLNDPRVYKDKFKLRQQVSKFERATGIKYPFKG